MPCKVRSGGIRGSACGPRAPFGGSPNGFSRSAKPARWYHDDVKFAYAQRVFGQRPKTARQRRALPRFISGEFFPEAQSAQTKKQNRHHNEH